MKYYSYKGQVITANSKEEAIAVFAGVNSISKICASYAKVSKNYNKTYDSLVDEWNANNKTKGWYSNKSNFEGNLVKNALNRNEFDIAFSFVLMDYSSEDTCLLVVSKKYIPKNKCDKVLKIASKALESKGTKRGHNNFIKVIICSTRQCEEPFYYKTGPKKVPSREQEALKRKERQKENKREYSRRYHQNNKTSKTDWDAIRRLGLAPSQPIVPDKL